MAEIFLMEDSAPLRRILTEGLRTVGHNVTALEDGSDSTDNGFMERADLVITDLDMPNVDGRSVVENIRMSHPSLPVIVITGLGQEATLGVRCDEIILKPVRMETLVAAVDNCLKGIG